MEMFTARNIVEELYSLQSVEERMVALKVFAASQKKGERGVDIG